jgi:hypothetical protein
VSRSEYDDLLDVKDRQTLFDQWVSPWLKEKTVLLLGCDPVRLGDFFFLDRLVLAKRDGFKGGAFLIWQNPSQQDIDDWNGRNVTIVDHDPVAFLKLLAAELEELELEVRDPEAEMFEGLAGLLLGSKTSQEVGVAVETLPPGQRPQEIQIAFHLALRDNTLQTMLTIDYEPDIAHYQSWSLVSDISLDDLHDWRIEAGDELEMGGVPGGTPVEDKGRAFFDKIVPPDHPRRRQYEIALDSARKLEARMRYVFEFNDGEGNGDQLSPVPWELLHDQHVPLGRGFLGLNYPVYRYPDSSSSSGRVTGKIEKALIVAVDPTASLEKLDEEVTKLTGILEAAGIEVDSLNQNHPDVDNPAAIKKRLRDGGYQLLHFTGHGQFHISEPWRSSLILGHTGEKKHLTARELGQVAVDPNCHLVLVVLSACEVGLTDPSLLAQKKPWLEAGMVDALTRSGVPATLGMRWEVGEESALELMLAFYQALLDEETPRSVEEALLIALQDIGDKPDWVNPILTKRHGVLG